MRSGRQRKRAVWRVALAMVATLCLAGASEETWDAVYQRATEGFHQVNGCPVILNGHPFTEGGKSVSESQLEMALHERLAFGQIAPMDVVQGLSSDRLFVRYTCVLFIARVIEPSSGGVIRFDGHWVENPAENEEGRKAIERCRLAMAGYGKMPELVEKIREGVCWQPRNFVEAW